MIFGADADVPYILTKGFFAYGLFKLASIPFTIFILFLVYWKLPNTQVPWRQVLPRAAVIGLLLEALKWVNWLTWPWFLNKFRREYGVFSNSITILTWSFFAALVVLAGADWSARRSRVAEAISKTGGDGGFVATQERPLPATVSDPVGRIG